jgi:hypothetical protein
MKKTIVDRYEITDTGQVIVDVSVRTVQDLYHNFDKTAPYYRKELDQELADYLIECVREIGKRDFVIRISLETSPEEALMERVRNSIQNYFVYLKQVEFQEMHRMLKKSLILFGVGLIFLVLAIIAARRFAENNGVVTEVFTQGLTIAAWVSLWEAIANLFLEWQPHRLKIKLYNRIAEAPVMFRELTR